MIETASLVVAKRRKEQCAPRMRHERRKIVHSINQHSGPASYNLTQQTPAGPIAMEWAKCYYSRISTTTDPLQLDSQLVWTIYVVCRVHSAFMTALVNASMVINHRVHVEWLRCPGVSSDIPTKSTTKIERERARDEIRKSKGVNGQIAQLVNWTSIFCASTQNSSIAGERWTSNECDCIVYKQ